MTVGIDAVVRESARLQVTLHRVTGGVWVFLGALFVIVAAFVPGKPGEENLRVLAGVGGAACVAVGVGYIKVMTARIATLTELLLGRRTELSGATLVAIRNRGRVVAHAITVRDSSSRRYRMRVPSEAAARAILANIPP